MLKKERVSKGELVFTLIVAVFIGYCVYSYNHPKPSAPVEIPTQNVIIEPVNQ